MTSYASSQDWQIDQDRARAGLIAREIVDSMSLEEIKEALANRLAAEFLNGDTLIDPEEPTCKGFGFPEGM